MIYGYMRPLYNDMNLEKQRNALAERCDVIYEENHGSPKKRMELEDLLMELEPGDTIISERMAAIADTFHHFLEVLKVCKKDKVNIYFIKEDIQSDTMLQFDLKEIMVYMIDFQSDLIKQSTSIGIDEARKSGKSIGCPKKADENVKKAISMYQDGYTLIEIKNETGISKSTLYRYLEAL